MASLESGRRLGPYEIVSPAGAGGMGEVYKAKDTRLDRTVAIKILPSHLAGDPDLRKRFEQEARAVSSLNHPHICTLYDIGREDGVDFMVMEFLEGETLGERLKRGALPLTQALLSARQIADALEKAHRSGVVHRDLKPGNVMLTKDGVKLLDFGLAKQKARGIDPALSSLPTQNQPLTREGSIVGTLHYMAPEQLEGKDVDARADLFSLGAVLYEMVTGRRAFTGESPASIITSIMSATPPPMTEVVPVTPASLERLVNSCLTKDPESRWQSAGDLVRELSWVTEEKEGFAPPKPWGSRVATLVALLTLGVLALTLLRPRATPELVRFTISPPEGASLGALTFGPRPSVSPDGSRIAFAVQREGSTWLAVRALGAEEPQILAEAGRFSHFAWSPDGRSLLYAHSEKLMRRDLDGGAPRAVYDLSPVGVAWSVNGAILAGQITGPIRRVDGGGDFSTTSEEGEGNHTHPHFLPDGERFLFYVPGTRSVYLTSLDSTERTLVRTSDSGAIYVEPGHLLFVDGGTLMAQRFHEKVEGAPVTLAEGIVSSPSGAASFSATTDVLAYSAGRSDHRLEWFDREGRSLGAVGEPGPLQALTLSPDGRRAIVSRGHSIWILDLERGGIASRLTSDEYRAGDPAWSPDGREIVMSARLSSSNHLYRLSLSAGAEPELVLSSERNLWSDQWLAADNRLSFHDGFTISLLPMDGNGGPEEIVHQKDRLDEPHRSPDGKWLAFISQETGRYEVYVERLDTRERLRVSSEGGGQPRWRSDGRELFYLSADAKVMAIDFDPELGARGVARTLFEAPVGVVTPELDQWDVHPDGERFLFLVPAGVERPLHVVLHWRTLLEENGSR